MPNGSHILANGCGAANIVRIATVGANRITRIACINRINGIEEVNTNGRDRWDQRQWMDGRGEKIFSPLPSVLPSSPPPPPPHRHRRHRLHRTCTISGTSCVVSLILIGA